MKLSEKTLGSIVFFLMIFTAALFTIRSMAEIGSEYETNDLADYGKITGNYDNDTPAEFMKKFFPEEILSSYSDVTYHYNARKGDAFAYERYLEFVIENEAEFHAFVAQYENQYAAAVFDWESNFMEYSISNVFDTEWTRYSAEKGYPIQYAEIGKVLYDPDEQRIILWALGTWDGGGTGTAHLHYFFDKFGIDVLDYQMKAYVTFEDQQSDITYQDRYNNNMPTYYPYPEIN